MGGAVAVTVRKKDGTVVPMCRWTNPLPFWIRSRELILNPEQRMEKFIEYGKTSAYNHEDARVAPEGYGLVVIDLKDNKIYTHQDYTSFNKDFGTAGYAITLKIHNDILDFKLENSEIPYLNLSKLTEHLRESHDDPFFHYSDDEIKEDIERMKDIYWLVTNKRITLDTEAIKRIKKNLSTSDKFVQLFLKLFSKKYKDQSEDPLKRWKSFLKAVSSKTRIFSAELYNIDLSPLEVIDYRGEFNTDLEGFTKMKEDLLKAGFDLSGKTGQQWDDWLSELEY